MLAITIYTACLILPLAISIAAPVARRRRDQKVYRRLRTLVKKENR